LLALSYSSAPCALAGSQTACFDASKLPKMSTQPYDPPPSSRSSSRPSHRTSRSTQPPESVFERIEHGLDAVEHYASEAEYIAGQVGKAARVGKNIEREVEEAYGAGSQSGASLPDSESERGREHQSTALSSRSVSSEP
jgi:hypothetical protein